MNMWRTVYDLNRDELTELKQSMYCRKLEAIGDCPSYGELAMIDDIVSDEEVYEEMEGYCFVDDDFFCNLK